MDIKNSLRERDKKVKWHPYTQLKSLRKLVLFYLFISSFLSAQNIKDTVFINEAVLSDKRLNTNVSQNRNVYTINKEQIDHLPSKSIQEILQYAIGVDVRQRGPFGSQADLSLDGGSFEQTLVLVNGVKISDQQTAHNTLNLPIPTEVIERIEVIRGPVARVYGNNSLTGVINIITRKPKKTGVFVHTYAGSNFKKDKEDTEDLFNGKGIQIGAAVKKEKHNHILMAGHEAGNGYRYNTAFENNNLLYLGNLEINENNSFNTTFGYVNKAFGTNGFYAAPGDRDSKEIIQTTLVAIQSKHRLNDRLTLSPGFNYRYNFDDYRYFKHDISKGRSKHYSNGVGAELNALYRLNNGQIELGIEYRNDQISSTSIKNHTRENIGVYTEYTTDITPKLNINVGSYFNYNSNYGWQIFPGLDASYAISKSLKLVMHTGTSQRIPSFTDLYLDQRPGNIGNADLKSEKAFQVEAGFKYRKSRFTFDTFYFYRKIDNFIDWGRLVSTEPWQSDNFGDMKTNGVNAKVNYILPINLNNRWKFGLNYSYLDPKFSKIITQLSSKYKIESLRHQIINTIEFQHKKTSLLLANRFNERLSYKSYWITDLRLKYSFDHFTVYLDTQNLFNTSYNEVAAIPLPSRWFTLGIKFINF